MDLQLNEPKELQKIPATTWFRLRNLAEQTAAALIALTPAKIITSAHLRLHLQKTYTLTETQDTWQQDLQKNQTAQTSRQRQTLRQSA